MWIEIDFIRTQLGNVCQLTWIFIVMKVSMTMMYKLGVTAVFSNNCIRMSYQIL